jgi:hypothetical protein
VGDKTHKAHCFNKFPGLKLAFRPGILGAAYHNRPISGNESSTSWFIPRGTVRAVSANPLKKRGSFMFLILAVVLVLLWLGGFFVLHVSSFLIHLLLIFALISIIMNFVGGRRAV